MKDIKKEFIKHCEGRTKYLGHNKASTYDDTTLFCTAGMQAFKHMFKDPEAANIEFANIQDCIRLNDLASLHDNTHHAFFQMLGFFSFRSCSVPSAILFLKNFLKEKLSLDFSGPNDYVTIHPEKYKEWRPFYNWLPDDKVIMDSECIWSDGDISGYCTEFYINGIEVGNIVNPLGHSIDCGFGLERLEIVTGVTPKTEAQKLEDVILNICDLGVHPGNKEQAYALRKLLRLAYKKNYQIPHIFYNEEISRQTKLRNQYEVMKHKFAHKPKEWWLDTHGIDLDLIT